MDNISFHRSKDTLDLMDALNIVPLRLIAYNSHFNSAEFIFMLAKRIFRKKLLLVLQTEDLFKIDGLELVDEIFNTLVIPPSF